MLDFNDKNKLAIFENFVIDFNLSKYNTETPKNEKGYTAININDNSIIYGDELLMSPKDNNDLIWVNSGAGLVVGGNERSIDIDNDEKINLFKRIILFFINLIKPYTEKRKISKVYDNIFSFFNDFEPNLKTIKFRKEISDYYEITLKQAIELNQTALIEKLKSMISVYKYEVILYEYNWKKYLTEEQIVDFYKNYTYENKQLKLTWIKNYTRIMPVEIYHLKKKVDNLKVFDNYVILHYDPKDNSTEMTEKEKEIAKDPILFGVISKSRKLYYIGDWKDEYCTLTLDEYIQITGEKINKINRETIKEYINEI